MLKIKKWEEYSNDVSRRSTRLTEEEIVQVGFKTMPQIPKHEFLSSIGRLAESVYDFHHRFGVMPVDINDGPDLALEVLRKQFLFLMEEAGEHASDLNKGELDKALLELADVAFVALGGVYLSNARGAEACLQVAVKNDKKTHKTHVVEESSGKIIKRAGV